MSVKCSCEKCGRKNRRRCMKVFHGQLLCCTCFSSKSTTIPFGKLGPRIYDEELAVQLVVLLTLSQDKAMRSRANNLGKTFSGYVRDLVTKDLEVKA